TGATAASFTGNLKARSAAMAETRSAASRRHGLRAQPFAGVRSGCRDNRHFANSERFHSSLSANVPFTA
ncbi:MAG: hypothetical protein ACKON9_27350, partial [Planctomycetaceae bacterium]